MHGGCRGRRGAVLPAWYQDETLTDYEGPMSRHFEIECAMRQAELEAQGTTYRLRRWSGCNSEATA